VALPLANPLIERETPNLRATSHPQTSHSLASHPLTSRSSTAPRLLCLWHLASFDAPTVAVVWAFAFAWLARVHLEWWVPLLLASGTWSVYIADRLLDARRAFREGRSEILRERHHFHWRHRRVLVPFACGAAAFAALLIERRMPIVARERNSIVAAAALIYFSGVHSTLNISQRLRAIFSKELLVGLIFTAGCVAPTVSRMNFAFRRIFSSHISNEWPVLVCFAFFAALAWVNCSAIEIWESRAPRASSLPHTAVLSVAGILISVALSHSFLRASALIGTGAVSAILLMALDHRQHDISRLTLRTLADAVLLVPGLLVLALVVIGAHHA
jgi:hypothetical protein